MTDSHQTQNATEWVDGFRPALKLALDEFLATGEWPKRERFRRTLVRRNLDQVNLDELFRDMPKSPWESRQFPPDRIVLTLQVLQEMEEAQRLLGVCVAIASRAFELYRSSDEDEPELRSDDRALTDAADGDARLLLCACEVAEQHPPSPLGGGGSEADPTKWRRWINQPAIHSFKGVSTIDEYLAAQERVISGMMAGALKG